MYNHKKQETMLQCEVIGNIGKDAEVKEFGGKNYVSFNVAHSERKMKGDGTPSEQTVWVSVLWYGEGRGIFPYLKKGRQVFVRGRMYTKAYLDKNGNPQTAVNLNASEVTLLGARTEGQDAAASQQSAAQLQSSRLLQYAQQGAQQQTGYIQNDLPFD